VTLAAQALDIGFGDRVVGRGITLAFPAGEVTCLLGPNGSGKTTLLRTLTGLLAPLAGSVSLDGRALDAWGARDRAGRLAYVPQDAESHFDFTLRQVVEMGRLPHRGIFASPGPRDREAAHAALERVGLATLADRPLHRVSGGERQLALIARALATGATHVLMDEPTANLDFGNQALVLSEVARMRARGTAVIFTTHHPDQALAAADRAVLLREGRVMADAPAESALTTASLTALYGRW
jgi:iron complex transport system ATP-binding protein